MAYNEFAYFYDEFNGEADYDALYGYVTGELKAHGITDGILADLGCGTGAIALMLLARQPEISVTGVEMQPHAADMARRSARLNGVEQRFRVLEGDMREIYRETGRGAFSLAVCNPPYFKEGGALKNPAPALRAARHEGDLSPGELCAAAARLLKFGGRFCTVFPSARAW